MLEGRLTRLRPMEPDDLENYYAWLNDNEVKQYLAMRYFVPREAERQWLAARAGAMLSFNNVHFAIETLEGRHIGSVGLDETRAEDRKASFGILIGDKEFWSRGYGTDATTTLLRFCFDEMGLNRVMLHVDERNKRAIACYLKCGFREEGRLRQDRYAGGRYWDTIVMAVLADEYRARFGVLS